VIFANTAATAGADATASLPQPPARPTAVVLPGPGFYPAEVAPRACSSGGDWGDDDDDSSEAAAAWPFSLPR
jgi:hypothetical protein